MATYNAGIVTAYGAAVQGGYTGTYEQFCLEQAGIATNAQRAEEAAERAEEAASHIGSGLTEEIKQALLQLAQKVAYIDDGGSDYYNDLYNALYEEYTVTYALDDVTSSNTATTATGGSSYTTTLTADSGYITTLSITMGGVDITSQAWTPAT